MSTRRWATDDEELFYDVARAMIGTRVAECSELLYAEETKVEAKQDKAFIAEITAMQWRFVQQSRSLDILDMAGNKALIDAMSKDVEHKTWFLLQQLMHPMHADIIDMANLPDPDDIPNMGRDLALAHINLMREKGELIYPSLLALEQRLKGSK
ncbi:hypothetical protein ABHF33_13240 [Chitinibacter sp. FCG-7]|uniref:Uncharacterized protein n=1 Tax=Chitinibacter mangrovi TaxID=3153927 RepID=A0AAU7F844_9NEIS